MALPRASPTGAEIFFGLIIRPVGLFGLQTKITFTPSRLAAMPGRSNFASRRERRHRTTGHADGFGADAVHAVGRRAVEHRVPAGLLGRRRGSSSSMPSSGAAARLTAPAPA